METTMVIASKKRYWLSPSGLIEKNAPVKTIRKDMLVTRQYVEDMNKQTKRKGNGLFFEIDEKKTEAYYAKAEKEGKARQDKKEMEKTLAVAKIQDAAKASLGLLLGANTQARPEDLLKDAASGAGAADGNTSGTDDQGNK